MPMATKEEQREYQRKWIAARRQAWIDEHGPCVQCGSDDRLEVDHIDPSLKLINPRNLWGMSDKNSKKIDELAKCQVLCFGCHKAKTLDQRPIKAQDHGSSRGYKILKCRCGECRAWNRDQRRTYRASKKVRQA